LDNGAPDCTRNPDLRKQFIVVFRPIGCTGTGCSMVRAFVFAETFPISSIPEGTLLYTCRVAIQPTAPLGNYPLLLSAVALSDTDGNSVSGAVGLNGSVTVVAKGSPTASPSITPTTTSTPSPTSSPTVKPPCVGDCNGDGETTIDELLTMVNISLESLPVSACLVGDANGDGAVTVDEIIAAVNNASDGCPA
ncbi:MAG TPA: hypothetical protein VMT89_15355, partial [Candidatus Acidoferrales bacterium]|nr:hypothetical protein [Candidatus Acidoferrales bacterium]